MSSTVMDWICGLRSKESKHHQLGSSSSRMGYLRRPQNPPGTHLPTNSKAYLLRCGVPCKHRPLAVNHFGQLAPRDGRGVVVSVLQSAEHLRHGGNMVGCEATSLLATQVTQAMRGRC